MYLINLAFVLWLYLDMSNRLRTPERPTEGWSLKTLFILGERALKRLTGTDYPLYVLERYQARLGPRQYRDTTAGQLARITRTLGRHAEQRAAQDKTSYRPREDEILFDSGHNVVGARSSERYAFLPIDAKATLPGGGVMRRIFIDRFSSFVVDEESGGLRYADRFECKVASGDPEDMRSDTFILTDVGDGFSIDHEWMTAEGTQSQTGEPAAGALRAVLVSMQAPPPKVSASSEQPPLPSGVQ
jgi:hypothetical protein